MNHLSIAPSVAPMTIEAGAFAFVDRSECPELGICWLLEDRSRDVDMFSGVA